MQDSLEQQLYQLEERLLQPEIRRNQDEVGRLLADDFREFGSSACVFDKSQILEALKGEAGDIRRVISQFEIRVLAFDAVLATYRVTRRESSEAGAVSSLRSSIWKLRDGSWQMVFHQGTLMESGLTEN
ncbi:DUF4440 domain-containing protein [bacterium]|nr:MAG: DUF4440 domain-containing protein [bacterium]